MEKNDKNNSNNRNKTGKKVIEQTVKNLIAGTIENLGLELWDVEYYNDNGEWLLEVTIDLVDLAAITEGKTGISLDDCEKVTKAISPIIDDADPIENSYSLIVSSPGLNRELKDDVHLNKYDGKLVLVKLFVKNENLSLLNIDEKSFTGILKEYSDEAITFEVVEKQKESAKANNKQKNKKNNIIDTEAKKDETKSSNISNIITLMRKDIAHIYAYDEL